MIIGKSMTRLMRMSRSRLLTEKELRAAIRRNPKYTLVFGSERLWNDIQKTGAFQVWTKEFITEFANYLLERLSAPNSVILDAGAGNGLLTFWLRALGLNVVAVDDRSWPEWSKKWKVNHPDWVLPLGYQEGLTRFSPEIVIVSWMPPYVDWTPDFRIRASVKEYILIGDAPKPPRIRPHNTHIHCEVGKWESWDEYPGWEKQELQDLTRLSVSYMELLRLKEVDHFYHKSRVVSFRRTI